MKKKRVLVVEDQKLNRQILTQMLEDTYEVVEAENGKDAFDVLSNDGKGFNVILLDIIMPEMDGYEFLEKIKDTNFESIPIIVMTADKSENSEQRALDLGAVDYVPKPCQANVLLIRIENAIAKSQMYLIGMMRHQAEHDPLTDLYNRSNFIRKTREMLTLHQDITFALVRIDIDRFRLLNNLWGEQVGDHFLLYMSRSIQELADEYEIITYGRIDADVFTMCVPYEKERFERDFSHLMMRLISYNTDFNIKPSAGVYVIDEKGLTVETCYMRASLAAKNCKGKYMENLRYYDVSMEEQLKRDQEIVDRMECALINGEFQVYLQPKFNLQTGKPYGAEALVRWMDPKKGMISPAEFIPVLERNGFIAKLDLYIWERVCHLLAKWKDKGYDPAPISVNMSRMEMYDPKIVQKLTKLVKKYKISPKLLNLELTESAYMDNPEVMGLILYRLHEAGFKIMMDDFGSGYSSLNTLKDIEVDYLKVDMNFMSERSNSKKGSRAEIILASVIKMATWLGLPVIVEGVETQQQSEYLKSIGCEYAQGYLFARPMPVEDYELLISGMKQNEKPVVKNQTNMAKMVWNENSEMDYLFQCFPLPVGIYEFDGTSFSLLRNNEAFSQEFAENHRKQIKISSFDMNNYQRLRDTFFSAIETNHAEECDYVQTRKDGEKRYYRVTLKYLGKNGNRPILIASLVRVTGMMAIAFEEIDNVDVHQLLYQEKLVLTVENEKALVERLSQVFELVRVIDPVDCVVLQMGEQGELLKEKKGCYCALGREKRCFRCVGNESFADQKMHFSIEFVENRLLLIITKPCEVILEGKKVVNVIEVIHEIKEEQWKEEYRLVMHEQHLRGHDFLDQLTDTFHAEQLVNMTFIKRGMAIYKEKVGLIWIELQQLKEINEDYGSIVGEHVLNQVAELLKNHVREKDSVIRTKGNEFMVLLTNCSEEIVKRKMEEFQEMIREIKYAKNAKHILEAEAIYCYVEDVDGDENALQNMIKKLVDNKMS